MAADDANDLRRALENNEIVPYFQPLVELRTGLLSGFEALARWQHPQRGLIPPNEFIPLAEKSGLHGLLTGKLLSAVFAAAKDIPDHLTLSVNISLTQLTDLTLPRHIFSAAQQANFPLQRLVLEITESALVGNTEHAARIANELKEQGSRLALDDFGTGYSSLRHLQLLPFDELKIDASFVRSMNHTRESRKIAAAIVGLGNSLSLTTVAEGVESQTIADMLLWLGCDIGQGWLYGRPVPPEQLPETLAERLNPTPPSGSTEPRSAAAHSNLPLRLEALPTQRLAQLNAIYDGVPVGLCYLDRNLRYVSVNRRLAEMNNLPVASHLGRHMSEVLPAVFPECEPYLLRALDGHATTGLEISSPDPHPSRPKRTYLISYQPARDEVDEVIGVSVSVVDISRRKQAEQALAESEDHYRNAVELSPQVPWTADPDGMILDTNKRWETLTGLTRQESLGKGWVRALHPDDVFPTLKTWEEALRTGKPLDIQYRIHRGDGVWRWMRVRAAPRRNEDGKIIRWYGTLEDIDDHKKAEEALRRSEARLHAIFDAAPIGIVIADAPDGRVVMSNPRAEDILRTVVAPPARIDDYCRDSKANAPGSLQDSDSDSDSDAQQQESPLADAIMNGRSIGPREYLRYYDDGTSSWISLTAAPVLDIDGKVSGGVIAIQDIDEDKREMHRLSQLTDALRNKLATHR
jgi:PAS domain S-box-containing protein